jgi:hypothetical protein
VKRENDSGGALLLLAHGGPSPGKELVQAIVRPKIDEADENVGEIGLGLYAVQFASLDQRSEDGPIFGAVIVTREESILARKSLRAHGTLDDIGVELDAAVIKEADEAAPMPEAVADDPGGIRSAREPRELMLEEDLERVDEWTRSYLARGTAPSVAIGASPRSAISKNSRLRWLQQKATVILSAGSFLYGA